MDMDTDNVDVDANTLSELDPRHFKTGIETFWEEETGLIVLEAQGKLFCAQRSVLRYASGIFRDMLSLPQPPIVDQNEQHDGKPLIRLSDRSDELQYFLKALHHYHEFYDSPASTSVTSMTAILRLSNKYEVAHLRTWTIKELCKHIPISLKEYDDWSSRQTQTETRIKEEDLQALFSVVETAGVQRFLPFIRFYQCTGTPISYHRFLGNDFVNPAISILAIRQLEINHMETSMFCSDYTGEPCEYDGACTARMQFCFQKSLKLDRLNPLDSAPYFQRINYGDMNGVTVPIGDICEHCRATSESRYHEKRLKLWTDLPSIFGLPAWDELLSDA